MKNEPETKKNGNRTEFLLLIAVFAAPIIGAWVIYNFTEFAGPGDTTSYGELISPPIAITDINLGPGDKEQLYGKWSLIYLISGACEKVCHDNVAMLSSLRLSLGSNAHRLQVVVAAAAGLSGKPVGPGTRVIHSDEIKYAEKASAMTPSSKLDDGFYLVDPLGNMMMRYRIDSDGAGILQDIKQLLRYSRVG